MLVDIKGMKDPNEHKLKALGLSRVTDQGHALSSPAYCLSNNPSVVVTFDEVWDEWRNPKVRGTPWFEVAKALLEAKTLGHL